MAITQLLPKNHPLVHNAVETPLAILQRTGPFLLEIRFKPQATVTPHGMMEIHEERWKLFTGAPHVAISFIPPDLEVDLNLVGSDTHARRWDKDGLRAAALVAQGAIAEMVAKLYYAYYPPHFQLFVGPDEQEARAWMASQVAAIEAEGTRSTG